MPARARRRSTEAVLAAGEHPELMRRRTGQPFGPGGEASAPVPIAVPRGDGERRRFLSDG